LVNIEQVTPIDIDAPLPPPRLIPSYFFDPSTASWHTVDPSSVNILPNPPNNHPGQVTFLTWNIDAQVTFKAERSTKALELLKNLSPDFMCLQEVAHNVWKDLILKDGWIQANYYVTDIDCSTFSCNVHGTAILSKFKPNRVFLQDFHSEGNRKSLIMECTLHNSPILVSCLHLDSGKDPTATNIRNHQLRTQFGILESAENAIFMGDLNVHENEQVIFSPKWIDIWEILRQSEPGFTWDTEVNPFTEFKRKNTPGAAFRTLQERYDRIILKQVDSKWKAENIRIVGNVELGVTWEGNDHGIFPSDHLGLFATIVHVDG